MSGEIYRRTGPNTYILEGHRANGRFVQAKTLQTFSVPATPQGAVECYAGPDTLKEVVKLQQARIHGLPLPEPAPVQVLQGTLPREGRQTFAPAGDTLSRAVQAQRALGTRPADPLSSLHTMAALPCQRCGRLGCACPPAAPSVLDAVVARQQATAREREQCRQAAGEPAINRVVGML